jgi:hypothetical protein
MHKALGPVPHTTKKRKSKKKPIDRRNYLQIVRFLNFISTRGAKTKKKDNNKCW